MPTIRRSNLLTSNRKINSDIEETREKKEKENLNNPAEQKERRTFYVMVVVERNPQKIVNTVKDITRLACAHVRRIYSRGCRKNNKYIY